MLQRVFASLLCVLGVAALGLGIASATLWRPSDTLVATATGEPGTTLLVTEPGVLDLADDQVRIAARGLDGRVVVVLGRSEDVDAWVGDDLHTRVTGLADWHVLATAVAEGQAQDPDVEDPDAEDPDAQDPDAEDPDAEDPDTDAEADADGETEAATTDDEAEAEAEADADRDEPGPDPTGADMWWAEVSAPGEAVLDWTREEGRWSILVASLGPEAGPAQIRLTWPQEVRTPWLLPGTVIGSVLLLLGLAWWALILVGTRGSFATAPEPEIDTTGMTRRQLRELEERRAATKQRQPAIVSALGFLVPKPRPRAAAPEELAPGAIGGEPSERHGRRAARVGAPLEESPGPGEPTSGTRGMPWQRLGRRRDPAVGPVEPDPTTEDEAPAGPPVPTFGPPGAEPPASVRPPDARSSADAWRRTWGLTGDDDAAARPAWRPVAGPDEDSQDGGRR